MKLFRRGFAAVLAAAMVITAAPSAAFAEEVNETATEVVETSENAEITEETETAEAPEVDADEVAADASEDAEAVTEETSEDDAEAVIEEEAEQLSAASFVTAAGALETIYAELSGITADAVTAVTYTATSDGKSGSLTAEDIKYLVRADGSNVRIDIPGVKAGTYTLTVTAGGADVSASDIKVSAYDRSGYAHFNYTSGVGAYNDDGTLKDNAIVLYVTDETKNTVSLTVGSKTVTGIGNILNTAGSSPKEGGVANTNNGIMKDLANAGIPLAVRIIGTVKNLTDTTDPSSTALIDGLTVYDSYDNGGTPGDNGGMARMKSAKDVTIEGIGTDAVVDGWGFHFMCGTDAPDFGKSFELRNLSFQNTPEDAVGMEGIQGLYKSDGTTYGASSATSDLLASVEHCWIHNNAFYGPSFKTAAESDKTEGDGSCDFKRGQYLTVAYNYFEGCHKTNLVGSSDTSLQFNLTYHHNYWYLCKARGPLTRRANVHMYNNFIFGQTDYAMNTRADAYIFSESNLFYMCKSPQAVEAGAIKSYNDSIGSYLQNKGSVATVVTDKSETVTNSCQFSYKGIDYSAFDTSSKLSYIPSENYVLQEDLTEARKYIEAYTGVQKESFITPDDVSMSDISIIDKMGASPVSITTFPFTAAPGKVSKAMYAFTSPAKCDVTIAMSSSSAYAGVLVNEAGVCCGVVQPGESSTIYSLAAGSYAIQPMLFQPGDAAAKTIGTWKEMNIESVTVASADPSYDPNKLTGIEMNMSSKTILVGGTVNLSAKKTPSTAKTDDSVVWTSSNASVATVSNGTVTGVSKGSATITATLSGFTATCKITVSEPVAITGTILSTDSVTVTAGQSTSISASPVPSNTTEEYDISYASADKSIATVDSSGNITGVAAGTTTVTATLVSNPDSSEDGVVSSTFTAECEVTVLKGKELPTGDNILNFTALGSITNSGIYTVTGSEASSATSVVYDGVTLTKALKLNKGASVTFSTTQTGTLIVIAGRKAVNIDGTKTALGTGVLTVENLATGSHTLERSNDGESWIYAVLFYPEGSSIGGGDDSVTAVSLDKSTASVEVGKTITLTASVTPSDAEVTAVNWTSSDPSVATVKNGVVTGVADGKAVITATSVANSACTDSCVVTVGDGTGGGSEPVVDTNITIQYAVVKDDGTPSYASLTVSKDTTVAALINMCASGKNIVSVTADGTAVTNYTSAVKAGAKYLITYTVIDTDNKKTSTFVASDFITKISHDTTAASANFTDAELTSINALGYYTFAGTLRWIKGKSDLIAMGDPNTSLVASVTFTTENPATLKITAVGAGVNSSTNVSQTPTIYVKDASGNNVLTPVTLPATGDWTDSGCNISVDLPTAGTYTITNENYQARINTLEVVETLPDTNTSMTVKVAIAEEDAEGTPTYMTYIVEKDSTLADLLAKVAAGKTVTVKNSAGTEVETTDKLVADEKYLITYKASKKDSGTAGEAYELVLDSVSVAGLVKGSAIPEIKLYFSPNGVIDEDYRLVEGVDYTVKLKNNKKAYEDELPESYDKSSKAPLATITGKNNFKFTRYVYFNIPADLEALEGGAIEESMVQMADEAEFSKSGATPVVRVYNGDLLLRNGTDYTVKYSNNKKLGTATATIKGKGLYTGTVTKSFSIVDKDLSNAVIVAADKANKNNKGVVAKTAIKVYDTDGKVLSAGKDYDKYVKLTYAQATEIIDANGQAVTKEAGATVGDKDKILSNTQINVTVTSVVGSGYDGEATVTYAVTSGNLLKGAKATVNTVEYGGDKTYLTESDITAMKLGKVNLVYGEDYQIDQNSYTANLKKGTASVNIIGLNNYDGATARITFKIAERSTFAEQ